jgi:hypothetical protein
MDGFRSHIQLMPTLIAGLAGRYPEQEFPARKRCGDSWERIARAAKLLQLRFLFSSYPQLMGRVLGIVYRAISIQLFQKAGFTVPMRPASSWCTVILDSVP